MERIRAHREGEPASAVAITVTKGRYATILGDPNEHLNMSEPIPSHVFAEEEDVRLRIWFSIDGVEYSLLSPGPQGNNGWLCDERFKSDEYSGRKGK